MVIFHVITLADVGGAQSVVINLAQKSIADGHKVVVLSEAEGPMWDTLDTQVVKIKIPELQRSINLIKEIKVVRKLKKYYKQYNPDVIHLHSSKIGILGRLAFPKTKILYTIHGFDSIRLAFRKFLPIEKMLKNKAQFIVAVSNYDLNNLHSENIVKNTVTVFNGIQDWKHIQDFFQNIEIETRLTQLKSNNNYIIMSIARLSAPKRFDLFCETARELSSTDDRIKFVWIGNNIQPKNLPENVICLGEVKNAQQYLKYADIFVLMSDYEGMPMSIIEALCYGVPVIASDVGGISELLNNKNGFVVENNIAAFKEKIDAFFNNEKYDYSSFSKEARISFEKNFTVENMYNNYHKLYHEIYKKNNI